MWGLLNELYVLPFHFQAMFLDWCLLLCVCVHMCGVCVCVCTCVCECVCTCVCVCMCVQSEFWCNRLTKIMVAEIYFWVKTRKTTTEATATTTSATRTTHTYARTHRENSHKVIQGQGNNHHQLLWQVWRAACHRECQMPWEIRMCAVLSKGTPEVSVTSTSPFTDLCPGTAAWMVLCMWEIRVVQKWIS